MSRSLLLGNGFEINFNPNMEYGKIVEYVVNDKEKFISLLDLFLKENFFFKFYLEIFKIQKNQIHEIILRNIIFYDTTKSIEDNLNVIFDDIYNFFNYKDNEKIDPKQLAEELDIVFKNILDELEERGERNLNWWQKQLDFFDLETRTFFYKFHTITEGNRLIDDLSQTEYSFEYNYEYTRVDELYKSFFNIFNYFTFFFLERIINEEELELIRNDDLSKENDFFNELLNFFGVLDNLKLKMNSLELKSIYWLPTYSIFRDKYNFIKLLIKEFFSFYINSEFEKTKLVMEIFFNIFPVSQKFLSSYDQLITTNYNNYDFINRNVINIHGRINDSKRPIIWDDDNQEKNGKQSWEELGYKYHHHIHEYSEIDIMGLSLKNDENTIENIIVKSKSYHGYFDTIDFDLVINYYAFSKEDSDYFKNVIKKILIKYDIYVPQLDNELSFPISFKKQGYKFGKENTKLVKIFLKDYGEFWGFSRGEIKKIWSPTIENENHFFGETNTLRYKVYDFVKENKEKVKENLPLILDTVKEFSTIENKGRIIHNNVFSTYSWFTQNLMDKLNDVIKEKDKEDSNLNNYNLSSSSDSSTDVLEPSESQEESGVSIELKPKNN